MSSSVALLAAHLRGECIIGESTEVETVEFSVRVNWYNGSPCTSKAHNCCAQRPLLGLLPSIAATPHSLSRPARGVGCKMSIVLPNHSSVSVLQRGSDMNRVLIQRCFSCRGCQRTVRTVGAGRWVLRGCVASAVPSDGPHELAISSIVSKRGGGSGSRKSTKPPFCEDSNGDANSRVPKSGANLLISRRYPQRRPNRPTRS